MELLQQTCYVYDVPGLELEWRAVSAPSALSLVAVTKVALGLTRRHRATGGAFGTAQADALIGGGAKAAQLAAASL